MAVEIIRAKATHALALARTVRPEDAAEVLASGNYTPEQALHVSLIHSVGAWTLLFDLEVAAMFGVVQSDEPRIGIPWAITGQAVSRKPKAFFAISRRVVWEMLKTFPVLTQMVDARYSAALRWVKRLGFEVGEPVPFGAAQLPFCPIVLRRPASV